MQRGVIAPKFLPFKSRAAYPFDHYDGLHDNCAWPSTVDDGLLRALCLSACTGNVLCIRKSSSTAGSAESATMLPCHATK